MTDHHDLLLLGKDTLQTAQKLLAEIEKQKDEIKKQRDEIGKQKDEIEQQKTDLREQAKHVQALTQNLQDLRKEMMGFDDAARLLVEALEVWATSEPQKMWEETRKQIQATRAYLTKAEKYWSDDTRRLWIQEITSEVQDGLSQHIVEHRESVLKRANRSIVEMKSEHTRLENSLQDFLDDAIANTEKHLNETVDRGMRKMEITLSNHLQNLRENVQAMIERRDTEILQEFSLLPVKRPDHGHD
ncbi:hypothetical protein JKG47_00395 [Acidithiobacillus sp. MC6.1]|nr:hypothetical protein [Acidithiobacillus sp. MC6.1]